MIRRSTAVLGWTIAVADPAPQLGKVLGGVTSLVGRRPPVPSEVANYDTRHRRRLPTKLEIVAPTGPAVPAGTGR